MPFQICSRDSFPSLHLRKSLGRALASQGWPELRHLRLVFIPFSPFLLLLLLLPFFLFFSLRRCVEISERHSPRILRGCETNWRARIERVTMLYVVVSRRVSIKSASYVTCGVSVIFLSLEPCFESRMEARTVVTGIKKKKGGKKSKK